MSSKPRSPESVSLSESSRSPSRPSGITAVCLLGFVGAFVSYLGLVEVLKGGGLYAPLALLGIAFLVVKVVALFGLWSLQKWGYRWTLRVYVLSGLIDLLSLSALGLLFDALVVIYLAERVEYFE